MTMWTKNIFSNDQPKYESIAAAIQQYIAEATLKPSDKLPSQRWLAKKLGVTVGTVGRGYSLAEQKGLVASTVGRGCIVQDLESTSSPSGKLVIDLGLNGPPRIEDESLLLEALTQISSSRKAGQLLSTAPKNGATEHEQAAAKWISRRMTCSPDQVQICTGTQNALATVLLATTKPGDSILVEELCFPGMIEIAETLGRKLVPVAIDSQGLVPAALSKVARKNQTLYCVPTNHNPTSATMSTKRRKSIAKVIREKRLSLIEDDVYGLTIDNAPAPLATFVPDQAFLICSLAKTIGIGLRLAYLRFPVSASSSLRQSFRALTFFPPSLLVELATKLINDGSADKIVQQRARESKERLAIADRELRGLDYDACVGGNHLWLRLPAEWTPSSFEKAAKANNVTVYSDNVFSVRDSCQPNAIRISLGNARNQTELSIGLRRIVELTSNQNSDAQIVRY